MNIGYIIIIIIIITIIIIIIKTREKNINLYIYEELSDEIVRKIKKIAKIKKIENGWEIKKFKYRFFSKITQLDDFLKKELGVCKLKNNKHKIQGCFFLYTDESFFINSSDFFKNLTTEQSIHLMQFIPDINILNVSDEHLLIIRQLLNRKFIKESLNYLEYIKLNLKTDYINYLDEIEKKYCISFYNYFLSHTLVISGIDTSNYNEIIDYLKEHIIQFEYEQIVKRNETNNDYLMQIKNTFEKQQDYSKVLQLYSSMKISFDKWLCTRYLNYISYLTNKNVGVKIENNDKIYYYVWDLNWNKDEIFNYGINHFVILSDKKTNDHMPLLLINPKKTDSLCYIEPEDIIGILEPSQKLDLNKNFVLRVEKLIE